MGLLLCTSGNTWANGTAAPEEEEPAEQPPPAMQAPAAESAETEEGLADRVTFGGVISGAYQYEKVNGSDDVNDFDRGAVAVQPEISIKLSEADEVFLKFGFAAGNGLNIDEQPFVLAPWAADLEDDVKDINGSNRNYLLTAWYKHTFSFGEEQTLGITGGIIDAADYLDENEYANDEFTQFMNEALVNAANGFVPGFDVGGTLEWELGGLAIKGVLMRVEENDEGNSYNFYGVQAGYSIETALGAGNYRVLIDATSDDFSAADGDGDGDGDNKESLHGMIFSFDQALGDTLGVWLRFGWSDDDAAVDFKEPYSGGINISGRLWGREQDDIGLGYVQLSGGNQNLDRTRVAEGYVRFGLNEHLAFTLDVQCLDDKYNDDAGDDVDGWIAGARLTVEF
jgi:porin